jgi:hypothetical protein
MSLRLLLSAELYCHTYVVTRRGGHIEQQLEASPEQASGLEYGGSLACLGVIAINCMYGYMCLRETTW